MVRKAGKKGRSGAGGSNSLGRPRKGALATERLVAELRELIAGTREAVAQAVNAALVLLHWEVGQRIRTEILGTKRAGYGGLFRRCRNNWVGVTSSS